MNQADFGRLLGVKAPSISRYENGRLPEYTILEKIADYGKTTVEWILKGAAPLVPSPQAATTGEGPEIYDSSPAFDRELLEEIIAAVERRLAKKQKALPPSRKAFLIANLYDELWNSDQDLTPDLLDHHIATVS